MDDPVTCLKTFSNRRFSCKERHIQALVGIYFVHGSEAMHNSNYNSSDKCICEILRNVLLNSVNICRDRYLNCDEWSPRQWFLSLAKQSSVL